MAGRPALLARLLLMLGAETVCCRAGVPDFTRHPLACVLYHRSTMSEMIDRADDFRDEAVDRLCSLFSMLQL